MLYKIMNVRKVELFSFSILIIFYCCILKVSTWSDVFIKPIFNFTAQYVKNDVKLIEKITNKYFYKSY